MRTRWALALIALALPACAADIEVREGHDPDYDFHRLKTFAWAEREPLGDPRIDEESLDARVRRAADERLAEKGYRPGPAAEADFLLAYRAALGRTRSETAGASATSFEGIWTEDYSPRDAGGGSATVDRIVYEGTLVLRVLDGRSRQIVWQASAETEINPRRTAAPLPGDDKVRTAVRKMLEGFPP